MGLLDDAIREHLELKRRHGAAEEDVRRLEHEALGPVRREPVQGAAPGGPGPADAHEPAAAAPPEPAGAAAAHADHGSDRDWAHHPTPHDGAREAPPVHQDAGAVPHHSGDADPAPHHQAGADAAADPAPRGFVDEEPWLDEPDEVPAEEALDHPRAGQPTSEFSAQERAEAEGAAHPAGPGGVPAPAEVPADYVEPDEEPAEDVLEETPDFLQETPEHDRLWFEQRPPRDFDFNG